jgi:hypothetical protein
MMVFYSQGILKNMNDTDILLKQRFDISKPRQKFPEMNTVPDFKEPADMPTWVHEARANGAWSKHGNELAARIAKHGMKEVDPANPIVLSFDKFTRLITSNGKYDDNRLKKCLNRYGELIRLYFTRTMRNERKQSCWKAYLTARWFDIQTVASLND